MTTRNRVTTPMRRVLVMLVASVAAVALAACNATPTTPTVTEELGWLRVTHPVAWQPVAGPPRFDGAGLMPQFYLTNATLTVACPPPASTDMFEGCPAPIDQLPVDGVLVTFSEAGGLAGQMPPEIATGPAADDWPGPCRTIGGVRQVVSVLEGVVVSACLRGPELDAAEASVRAMINSLVHT